MNGTIAPALSILAAPSVKPRLLVAEDDLSARRFLCDLLTPFYEVEAAADGELAWAIMQRSTPDLLLTDLQMPNLDGLGLIRRARGEPRLGSLPIILLTACQEKELLLQCLAAGADDFLLKPFSCAELLACLQVELLTPRAKRDHGATYQTRLSALTSRPAPPPPSPAGGTEG